MKKADIKPGRIYGVQMWKSRGGSINPDNLLWVYTPSTLDIKESQTNGWYGRKGKTVNEFKVYALPKEGARLVTMFLPGNGKKPSRVEVPALPYVRSIGNETAWFESENFKMEGTLQALIAMNDRGAEKKAKETEYKNKWEELRQRSQGIEEMLGTTIIHPNYNLLSLDIDDPDHAEIFIDMLLRGSIATDKQIVEEITEWISS